MRLSESHALVVFFLLLIWCSLLSKGDYQKAEQTLMPQEQAAANTEIKCGTCPCVNPCSRQPPPLSPPLRPPQKCNPAMQYSNPVLPLPLPPHPPKFYLRDRCSWKPLPNWTQQLLDLLHKCWTTCRLGFAALCFKLGLFIASADCCIWESMIRAYVPFSMESFTNLFC